MQAHNDRRAEKTAEAAKYDAFGPNHGGPFRPFDCGRAALVGRGRRGGAGARPPSPTGELALNSYVVSVMFVASLNPC